MGKILMGYAVLLEDKVYHRADFETAAWYENVLIKAGKYPVYTDYNPNGYNRFDAVICYSGEIVSDYFGTLFYGSPVGTYDCKKNAGRHSDFTLWTYSFMFGEAVLHPDGERYFADRYELAPGFSVEKERYVSSVDGEEYETYRIRYNPET